MVKKFLFVFINLFFIGSGLAGPCDEYKKNINIDLQKKIGSVNINSSTDDLWPRAGYVVVKPYSLIEPKIGYVFNGKFYCVYLDSVDVTVGFQDFDMFIDKKYNKNSCEYNAVLKHENHHIDDSKKALDNIFDELNSTFKNVVNNIEPIYVENADDVPYAFEKIEEKITKDADILKLVEKFKKQTTDDAAELDNTPDEMLEKCTVDKVNAAFEKYYKKKGIKK